MKSGIFLATAVLLLAGSSEQKEQFQQEFNSKFRSEFISQCVASIPKQARLSTEKAQQYCTCSADKVLETLSATDIAKLMGGRGEKDSELQQKVVDAAATCMNTLK